MYNAKENRVSEERMQKISKEIDDHCAVLSCKYFVTTHIQNSMVYDEYLAMKITKEIWELCVFRRDVYFDKFVLPIGYILIKLSDVKFILKLEQLVNASV